MKSLKSLTLTHPSAKERLIKFSPVMHAARLYLVSLNHAGINGEEIPASGEVVERLVWQARGSETDPRHRQSQNVFAPFHQVF